MDICTEADNEKLIEALVKAAGAAFLSGLHPYISAWSYEVLKKSIIEQQIPDEKKSWRKLLVKPICKSSFSKQKGRTRLAIHKRNIRFES